MTSTNLPSSTPYPAQSDRSIAKANRPERRAVLDVERTRAVAAQEAEFRGGTRDPRSNVVETAASANQDGRRSTSLGDTAEPKNEVYGTVSPAERRLMSCASRASFLYFAPCYWIRPSSNFQRARASFMSRICFCR